MPLQYQVGQAFGNDNGVLNARGDNYGSMIIQQFNGRYAELARRGQLFNFSTPSQAIPISATGGGMPTIWNPAGSGKILYVLKLLYCYTSGTLAQGALNWYLTAAAGSNISATAPIKTFTSVAPVPMMVGSSSASSMWWGPTTNTFQVAPVFYLATGINNLASGPAGTVDYVDSDACIALMPGNSISLGATVATSALLWTTIVAAELPIPVGVI